MSDNPKNLPKSSGNPAGTPEDSTDLGGGATIPKKSGNAQEPDAGTALDAGATVIPDKQAQAPASSVAAPKEQIPSVPSVVSSHTSQTAPAEASHGATTGSAVDPGKTVPMSQTEKEAAANSSLTDRTIPKGLVVGRKLGEKGRFTLIRQLGKGGMGVVWLASDINYNGKEVALKLLPPDIAADPDALRDLKKETLVTRELTHTHIIRIHDLHGEEDEPAFVSMEFINGPNLRKKLSEQKPFPHFLWNDVKPLVLNLCDALEYAHEQNVIHRDLKPANLMLDSKGKLKLADFGIAATVANSMSRTAQGGSDGDNSGTLLYMSPQQMRGVKASKTDDIYSLGATVYELLTGKPPFFNGGQQAIMYQIKNEAPQSIKERLQEFGAPCEVPDYVDETILACLAKEPSARPQSAADIKSRLSGQGKLAPAQPDLGVPKSLVSSGAPVDTSTASPTDKAMQVGGTSGKLLDVSFADTKHPEASNANMVKFAVTCVVILLVLGLAWHFVPTQSGKVVRADNVDPLPVDTGRGAAGGTKTELGGGGKTDAGGTGNVTPKIDNGGKTELTGNDSGHGQTIPLRPPDQHRLVILPDTISDSARGQLDRDLKDKLELDDPSLVTIGLSGYLRDSFFAEKKFTMLERDQLASALKEVDLSAGKYGEAQLSKIGHMVSADYVLVPEVESLSVSADKKTLLGIDKPRITVKATAKVNFRIVDVATSTLLSSSSTQLSESQTSMGEITDKAQTARDVIGKLMSKIAQAELSQADKDVLHTDSPAAPAK